MKRLTAIVAVCVLAGIAAAQVHAAPAYTRDCLDQTTARALDTKRVVGGLGLPADQVRELRARLSTYGSVRNDFTLNGLGLTAAQITEIKRRIAVQVAEWNKYPLGYPCAAFKNPTKVMAYMKAELIDNGFRPRMTMTLRSPRQVQFVAIQDGVRYWGTVAKYGPRLIKTRLTCTSGCSGGTYSFQLAFDA